MAKVAHNRISPTAHYTAYLWYANGLSNPALATPVGRILHGAMEGIMAMASWTGARIQFKESMLCRHRLIDHLLGQAIESGEIGQVIECAAGLSGRGLRFLERYGERGLTWVDADLPEMAAIKESRIGDAMAIPQGYSFQEVDLMADSGPLSISNALGPLLRPGVGVAIITEGLIPYFPREANAGMWRRFGALLQTQPTGRYFGSVWTQDDIEADAHFTGFFSLLQLFVRGQMHIDLKDESDVSSLLEGSGLALEGLHRPDDFRGELNLPGSPGRVGVRIMEGRV